MLVISLTPLFANKIGADQALPKIEKALKTIKIPKNTLYLCSDSDVKLIIDTAARLDINVFELIDCVYRYLAKNKMRVEIKGSSLKNLMKSYDYGGELVLSLIPIPLIEKIDLGHKQESKQKAVQIFINRNYEKYIEIGTALYEKEFGFNKLTPNLFAEPYGMKVKKFGIKLKVNKIDLYKPGKIAISAKGFYKAKSWNLNSISKIK